jgi:DNA-binding transcriptional MerR regulator
MRGNCALYTTESREVVRRIQSLQEAGLTLGDIRDIFAAIAQDQTTNKHLTTFLRATVARHREAIYRRERELAVIRAELDRVIETTQRCDSCQARGAEHDCRGCGNLDILRTLGVAPADNPSG